MSDWVRLDNASNIFLAARTDSDPKVFRMAAEVDHDVDPLLLQLALDETLTRFPLYQSVLRSGVFWYYLQRSELHPQVEPEDQHTCAPIYRAGSRNLLFRVVHHHRRISLEVFHALSDGTGALWFLTDLLDTYAKLRAGGPLELQEADEPAEDSRHHLIPDSFTQYFRKRRTREQRHASSFSKQAALPSVITESDAISEVAPPPPRRRRVAPKVFHLAGTRTPDNRTRAVELTMPASQVLALARSEGVSLTIYLTALFLESVRRSSNVAGSEVPMAVSVPVNLRQFFPSRSARNFFATIRLEHTLLASDDVGSIARALERQFRPKATPEALEQKLRRLILFEKLPMLRVVPRPLKDVILGVVNHLNNRGLTVAISNLGRVALSEQTAAMVSKLLFHVSAARPQFCAISHGDVLTVSFTSPFVETDHIREFARELTGNGIPVEVVAAKVTEEELVVP